MSKQPIMFLHKAVYSFTVCTTNELCINQFSYTFHILPKLKCVFADALQDFDRPVQQSKYQDGSCHAEATMVCMIQVI